MIPLIYYFGEIKHTVYMYNKEHEYTEPRNNFCILYLINNNYFIDIGYVYEYGDSDYGRFDSFGFFLQITQTINIPTISQEILNNNNIYNIFNIETKNNNFIFYNNCSKEDCEIDNKENNYYYNGKIIYYEENLQYKNIEQLYYVHMDNYLFFVNNIEREKYIISLIQEIENEKNELEIQTRPFLRNITLR